MNNIESTIKVRPPFPGIPSFVACTIVLGYFQPTKTCLFVLSRISKSTKKYAEAHKDLIEGGTVRNQLLVYKFGDKVGTKFQWPDDEAIQEILSKDTRDLGIVQICYQGGECFEDVWI